MLLKNLYRLTCGAAICCSIVLGCTISYKFNQASIDYSKVKTVSVDYFENRAQIVNPTLSNQMTEALKDKLLRETKLTLVTTGGDLQFSGEITGYTLRPMGIQGNAVASVTRLTMTVKAKFINKSDESQDYESSFSNYQDFTSTQNLSSVEGQLTETLTTQISEDIFNKALANW